MIYVKRSDTEAEDGLVKSLFIGIGKVRVLGAWSESVWYTKGKPRKIPVWIDKEGLFIYRLAFRIGLKK